METRLVKNPSVFHKNHDVSRNTVCETTPKEAVCVLKRRNVVILMTKTSRNVVIFMKKLMDV